MSNNNTLTFDVSLDGGEDFVPATNGVRVTVNGLKTPSGEKIELTVAIKPEQITLSAFSESVSALAAGNQVFDGSIAYDDLVRDITGDVTTKQVLEQALYWLEAEAANPGEAKPDEILKSIRRALGYNPDEAVNEFPERSDDGAMEFKIEGEKTLYLKAFSVDDQLDDPEFASTQLNAPFLQLLNKLKTVVDQNDFVTEVRAWGGPLWRPDEKGEETFDQDLSIEEIVVYKSGFWFRSAGKNGGAIESRIVSWKLLTWILAQSDEVIFMPDQDIEPTIEDGADLKQLVEGFWADMRSPEEA